jgi:hypothetical protein
MIWYSECGEVAGAVDFLVEALDRVWELNSCDLRSANSGWKLSTSQISDAKMTLFAAKLRRSTFTCAIDPRQQSHACHKYFFCIHC